MQPYKSGDSDSRDATATSSTTSTTSKCTCCCLSNSSSWRRRFQAQSFCRQSLPLVAVIILSFLLHTVSSLPTLPIPIQLTNNTSINHKSSSIINTGKVGNNGGGNDSDASSAAVREFAANGFPYSDGVNFTDDLDDLPDPRRVDFLKERGFAIPIYTIGNGNDSSSSIIRDFAAGIESSDGVNFTDDFQDQPDVKRVDVLRERNRQQRLVSIQKTILEKLGLFQTPNISNPHHVSDDYRKRVERVFRLLQSQPQNVQTIEPEDIYAKRVQSFYPSCSLPRNMDRDLWSDARLFHIYYEIPIPQLVEGTSMTVSSAKLRLYKMAPLTENSVTSTLPSSLSVTNSPSSTMRIDKSAGLASSNSASLSCDERIRITVYQYTKPLKKSKKMMKRKRKLIDSRMVSLDFEGWLEFDVRSSARDWLENASRNLGLEIELEDSMANTRNPSEYLRNMNCTEANEPPFPRFMEDRMKVPLGDEDTTALFENETYPTLDLKTIEIEDPIDVVPKSNKVNATRQPNVVRSLQKRHIVTDGCGFSQEDSTDDYTEESNCCKKDTYVSFADFEGGQRIVEPLGFYTKTCVGQCDPYKGEEYVCAPKVKSGIDVVVLDDNDNLIKVNLPDVVTKSCSCQSKYSLSLQTEDY